MKRHSIIPPKEMPTKFIYRDKIYQWYPNLKRDKKRRIIAIYRQFKAEIRPVEISSKKPAVQKKKIHGCACMQWSNKAGPVILGQFPDDLDVGMPLMMQIYQNHLATAEKLVVMESNEVTIISFLSGFDSNLYFIVLSDQGDNGDRYRNALEKYSGSILQKGEDFELSSKDLEDLFNLLQKP